MFKRGNHFPHATDSQHGAPQSLGWKRLTGTSIDDLVHANAVPCWETKDEPGAFHRSNKRDLVTAVNIVPESHVLGTSRESDN